MIIFKNLIFNFLYFLLLIQMDATSTPTTTTTTKKLQFFIWYGCEAEGCNYHSFGTLAFSKKRAIGLILESLHQIKSAQFTSNVVDCQGPFTAKPERFLDELKLRNGDDFDSALSLRKYLTTTVPEVYPAEEGLVFFTSALQG
jgi:hypothetical protein